MSDLALYARSMETAIARWTAYARTISRGAVHRLRGVDVAVFTDGPERDVFNNAVLAPQRIPSRRRVALDRMASPYDRDPAGTELARGVYAAHGFRELGRILEHGPPNRRAVPSGTSGAGPR